MSNLISTIVVGLGVAVSALPIVAVAGPPPGPSAARSAQGDGMPADPAPAEGSPAAPPSSPPPPEGGADPAPSRTVLLMKDGNVKILDGPAAEDRLDYVVTLDIGEIRIPKAQVEQRFASLREAYEYQRAHLPDRDPDEHMRLARWCLTHGMSDEAAEQLRALLAWSPGDRTAEAMLRNLSVAAAARSARDSGVVRTGADAGRGGAEPRELDVSVLGQIRAYKGRIPAPVIFDLPEPLAVRRFQEYGQTVHRVLQVRCASCHDELSDRNFRLIRARDPKDLTNAMLVRTNLDATIGLVDRANPGHSPLLINAVMPHGPDQKPIIANPNSPEYRAMWAWIESLRGDPNRADPAAAAASFPPAMAPAPPGYPQAYPPQQAYPLPQAAAPAPGMAADPSFGGGFAAQRPGPAASAPAPAPMPGGPAFVPDPNATYEYIQRDAAHPSVPGDLDFRTVSPLLGSPEAASVTVNGRTIQPPGAAAPAPAGAVPNPTAAGAGPPLPPSSPVPSPSMAPAPGIGAPPGFLLPPGVSIPGGNVAPAGGVPPIAPAPAGPVPRATPTGAVAPGAVPPPLPGAAPAPTPGTAPPGAPAPAAAANGVISLPDGTQIIPQADGSKVMRLPDGELVPYLDKAAVNSDAARPERGDGSLQIDPALLERLQRGRMGTAP